VAIIILTSMYAVKIVNLTRLSNNNFMLYSLVAICDNKTY